MTLFGNNSNHSSGTGSKVDLVGITPKQAGSTDAIASSRAPYRVNLPSLLSAPQGKRVPFGDSTAIALYPNQMLYKALQMQLNEMWNLRHYRPRLPRDAVVFAAPQPMTCTREVFETILKPDWDRYWVTEKADGKRFCLMITSLQRYTDPYIVLVNRQNEMFLVHFDTSDALHDGTLLDGELCPPDANCSKWQFKVCDIAYVCGNPSQFYPKSSRLLLVDQVLLDIQCSSKEEKRSPCQLTRKPWRPATDLAPFMKEFELNYLQERESTLYPTTPLESSTSASATTNNNNNNSSDTTDNNNNSNILLQTTEGFIFEREDAELTPFRSDYIYKWKPFLWNTCEFHIRPTLDQPNIVDLFVIDNNNNSIKNNNNNGVKQDNTVETNGLRWCLYAQQRYDETVALISNSNSGTNTNNNSVNNGINNEYKNNNHSNNNTANKPTLPGVFECVRDPQTRIWKIVKAREDKPYANLKQVVLDTERLLNNPLHLAELLEHSRQYAHQNNSSVLPTAAETTTNNNTGARSSSTNSSNPNTNSTLSLLPGGIRDAKYSSSANHNAHHFDSIQQNKAADLIYAAQVIRAKERQTDSLQAQGDFRRQVAPFDYQSTILAKKYGQPFHQNHSSIVFSYQVSAPTNARAIAPQKLVRVTGGAPLSTATNFPALTKYERARIIGARATQLGLGATTTIELHDETDIIDIATKELDQERIPIVIIRPYPNGVREKLDPNCLYLC
jgi:DNA-directed RNA polymerase subunit K/omega